MYGRRRRWWWFFFWSSASSSSHCMVRVSLTALAFSIHSLLYGGQNRTQWHPYTKTTTIINDNDIDIGHSNSRKQGSHFHHNEIATHHTLTKTTTKNYVYDKNQKSRNVVKILRRVRVIQFCRVIRNENKRQDKTKGCLYANIGNIPCWPYGMMASLDWCERIHIVRLCICVSMPNNQH